MKIDPLLKECLENVSPEVKFEVRINMDIANRISELLKIRKLSQRDLAKLMGKRESEISRWLSGTHGFTTKSIAKIATVLNDPIIKIKQTRTDK